MEPRNGIAITDRDERRLALLLQTRGHQFEPTLVEMLEEELARATVLSPARIPPDVVTMNSVVLFQDIETGKSTEITLVYPGAARGGSHVSVLAPMGTALLGQAIGDSIDWPMPEGRSRRIRVLDIRYQPEAQGDFDR